jgi:arsenite methyltransferase
MNDTSNDTPEDQVRRLYSQLALYPEQEFGWLKGKENAKTLGYDQKMLDQIPDVVWESSAAVGNPFSIGPIHLGETVVDLGCGAGVDLCVAALLVGETGKVFGIDLTPEMVEKARSNIALMHLRNARVELGDFLNFPLEDNCVDVVISNGAINLSPKQPCVFREIMRVLKPNGRLYLADMIRSDSPSTTQCDSKAATDSWANCVAGTLGKDCLEKLIVEAGFQDVEFIKTTGYHTSPETEGALFRARKPAD